MAKKYLVNEKELKTVSKSSMKIPIRRNFNSADEFESHLDIMICQVMLSQPCNDDEIGRKYLEPPLDTQFQNVKMKYMITITEETFFCAAVRKFGGVFLHPNDFPTLQRYRQALGIEDDS